MLSMPIQWKSNKVKRVVRSTLAAETLSCVDGCDNSFVIGKILQEILSTKIVKFSSITCKTDNKSLFDAAHTIKVISDARLRVEMAIVREMVDKNEIKLVWIESSDQLADALTKHGTSSYGLLQVVSQGKLQVEDTNLLEDVKRMNTI